jgi:LPXTG-site transpeptidase (sortase) family protein
MALDIFTKEELTFAWKILKVGFWVFLIVSILSVLFNAGSLYTHQTKGTDILFNTDNTNKNIKNEVDAQIDKNNKDNTSTNTETFELPLSLSIPSLQINTKIESPDTTSAVILDAALSRAAVYYQGSGTPGNRNMLIFGHSTGFSVVRNQAYKVFNTLKNAKKGEFVYVQTGTKTHIYKITDVKKVSKYSTWIQFNSDKAKLTLSTCDSFGKASDRWVVEGEYVGVQER